MLRNDMMSFSIKHWLLCMLLSLFYIEPLGLLVRTFQWGSDAIKAVIMKGRGDAVVCVLGLW